MVYFRKILTMSVSPLWILILLTLEIMKKNLSVKFMN